MEGQREVEMGEGRCTEVFSLFSVCFHSVGGGTVCSEDVSLLALLINSR